MSSLGNGVWKHLPCNISSVIFILVHYNINKNLQQNTTSAEFSSPIYIGVNFKSLICYSVYNITFQSPSSHSNNCYPLSCLSPLQNKVILTCRSNKKYNVFSLICIFTDYPFALYSDLYSKGHSMLSCKASLKEQILYPRLPQFIC